LGEKKKKLQTFLKSHPNCCFCGNASATTRDHVPPSAMFFDKKGPEGWVFPGCGDCNNGSSNEDRIFSIFALMFGVQNHDELPGTDMQRIMRSVLNGAPRELQTRIERFLSGENIPSEDYPRFELADSDKRACHLVARKIAKAIYYRERSKSLPKEAVLSTHWIPNGHWDKKTIGSLSKFISSMQAPTIENNNLVVAGKQFIFSIDDVDEYISICFQIHTAAIYYCLISPSGKVSLSNPAFSDWYDMKDNAIAQEPT